MYGTVARMRIKPNMMERFRDFNQQMIEDVKAIPGAVFSYVYQMDQHPDELYLCVGFESKDAYVANANSPEQHKRYLEYREYLAEEPEWHDGEIVQAVNREQGRSRSA